MSNSSSNMFCAMCLLAQYKTCEWKSWKFACQHCLAEQCNYKLVCHHILDIWLLIELTLRCVCRHTVWTYFPFVGRWGRWTDILSHGRFKRQLTEQDVETICRTILVYCLNHYRGDENIKSFIWDLITPTEDGQTRALVNHSGTLHVHKDSTVKCRWRNLSCMGSSVICCWIWTCHGGNVLCHCWPLSENISWMAFMHDSFWSLL